MVEPEVIIFLFKQNVNVIHMETEGLTHADSLLQLPFRGNCLNWVMGHILSKRADFMAAIGIEPIWTEEKRAIYRTGSAPITPENADTAIPLETMLADLDESQARLEKYLRHKTLKDMQAKSDRIDQTWGRRLAFHAWHEGYHAGQTEYLRQLAGKNDEVLM